MDNNTKKAVKLIMVTQDNNNKFYEMEDNNDGTFKVSYGRVGGSPTTATYPMNQWSTKYNEKVRKGYKDQTHLFAIKDDEIEFVDITDIQVKNLINELTNFAKKSIQKNYVVTADQVTKTQVVEAQRVLDSLVTKAIINTDITLFNKLLLELYQVIPRKMKSVQDHLIKAIATEDDKEEIQQMLAEEQATLDVMRGQVEVNEQKKTAHKEKKEINLLEAMGLAVEHVTDDSILKTIKDLMQEEASRFYRAFKVTNLRTQKKFENCISQKENKKIELFWHGSRNENWLSILETGLVLRPANAVISGKMFGYGLYFADRFKKSLGYTSYRGSYWASGSSDKAYLAIYEVHVGNPFQIKKHAPWCYDLTEEALKKKDAKSDSVFAEKGADLVNNEYIIYNENQCTVKYIIEIR